MKNIKSIYRCDYLSVIFIFLGVHFIKQVTSISCFVCDALEKQISDCPGWDRLPVHSITNLGDRNGFYTHCLDIRLADNTILHQNIIPYLPTCRPDFLMIWKASLEKQYRINITITCCDYNVCNGPIMINSEASIRRKFDDQLQYFLFCLAALIKILH